MRLLFKPSIYDISECSVMEINSLNETTALIKQDITKEKGQSSLNNYHESTHRLQFYTVMHGVGRGRSMGWGWEGYMRWG